MDATVSLVDSKSVQAVILLQLASKCHQVGLQRKEMLLLAMAAAKMEKVKQRCGFKILDQLAGGVQLERLLND